MFDFKWLFVVYAFVFGAALGSFLDVVINRTHNDEAWWSGRSRCGKCKRYLEWKELIPILSFLLQRGKCQKCGTKLSFEYILVEVLTGLLLASIVYFGGVTLEVLLIGILSIFLFGNFISDFKYMELPDLFSIPSIIVAFVYQYFYGAVSLKSVVIGVLVGGLFFGVQYVLTKGRGIGSGDIRLGVLMGALLGWPLVVVSLMLAYVSGSVIALTLIGAKKMSMKSALPLGVFLIPALVIVFIFKEPALEFARGFLWYNPAIQL